MKLQHEVDPKHEKSALGSSCCIVLQVRVDLSYMLNDLRWNIHSSIEEILKILAAKVPITKLLVYTSIMIYTILI